ncbi:hypothetical protein CC80DRAFT_151859 [Byssothecium circinans]|uniref:Uncharacterized protein n=1 Tax=Byssothecium circinans TaxID=147558 RepID=A0A6A5TNE2_9PLEO|nr:hypothetical protein CC80DRAFT_151859 [Byssothecium circinans]
MRNSETLDIGFQSRCLVAFRRGEGGKGRRVDGMQGRWLWNWKRGPATRGDTTIILHAYRVPQWREGSIQYKSWRARRRSWSKDQGMNWRATEGSHCGAPTTGRSHSQPLTVSLRTDRPSAMVTDAGQEELVACARCLCRVTTVVWPSNAIIMFMFDSPKTWGLSRLGKYERGRHGDVGQRRHRWGVRVPACGIFFHCRSAATCASHRRDSDSFRLLCIRGAM